MIGSFRLPISLTSGGTSAPTILSATVEDANKDKLVVVFSEVVDITDVTGLTITGDVTPTLSAPTGTGTNTITFTLSAALTNGQSVTLNVDSSNTIEDPASNALLATTKSITNNVDAPFDTDYQAVLDYATTNSITLPDSSTQTAQNQIVLDLKSNDIWSRLDGLLYFKGSAVTAFKLIDWKRLVSAIAFGGVTWSSLGVKGNATNGYIDTHYILGTDSTNFLFNDASHGANVFDGTNIGMIMGARDSSGTPYHTLIGKLSADSSSLFGRLNAKQNGFTKLDISGNNIFSVDASNIYYHNNGVLSETTSGGGLGIENWSLYLLSANTGGSATIYSDMGLGYWFAGNNLSDKASVINSIM